MSDQTYRKPVIFALASTIVLTATCSYYAYTQYLSVQTKTKSTPEQQGSLHRSNAVRRPRTRRNWRPGFQPTHLDFNPVEQALAHLHERTNDGVGYGVYRNTYLSPFPPEVSVFDFNLLPNNLESIYQILLTPSLVPRAYELPPDHRQSLRYHIHSLFVQNFLDEEFPEGYIIGDDDMYRLATRVALAGVEEEIVLEAVLRFDQGMQPFTESWEPPAPDPELTAWLEARLEPGTTPSIPPPQAMEPNESIEVEVRLNPNPPNARDPPTRANSAFEDIELRDALQALHDRSRDDDEESEMYMNNDEDTEGSQVMLDLLYHIAGEQARREGAIHRGVECNSCGVHPIQGIRYHCANCFDFDLCESCEASSAHTKSHVFYKIRIPAPSRGHIKQVAQKWYPGNPNAFLTNLPKEVLKPLLEETGFDRTEIDALYEQFKCLAGHYWNTDPTNLGLAIDRKGFDAYFIPTTFDKPSPANLIYDRIFAFYDTNNDGLIGFQEFIHGLARLQKKSRHDRLERIFKGYDLDADGFVDRKDFLRMFRAYYALSKELSREMINSQDDFGYVEEEFREIIQGSQPISAAFGGGQLSGHESRTGQNKQLQSNGDLLPVRGENNVLQPDSDTHGDRARAIGNAALGDRTRNHPFRTFRQESVEDEALLPISIQSNFHESGFEDLDEATESELAGPDPPLQTYGWPPPMSPEPRDILDALGQEVSLDDITDPVDRSRVLYAQSQRLDAEFDEVTEKSRKRAVEDRWQRRRFYLDEQEGMNKPAGYTEPDSSDDEEEGEPSNSKPTKRIKAGPRRQSMQSRSSSKVRFDDSAIDTDYETRSNTSSRSVPVNERWGGYELGEAEADIGKDILYQAVQQGFNELLDILFKDKEDEWLCAHKSRHARRKLRHETEEYALSLLPPEEKVSAEEKITHRLRAEELLMAAENYVEAEEQINSQATAGEVEKVDVAGPSSPAAQLSDPDDHIELMFGSKSPCNSNQETKSDNSYHDPTLPQYRPNTDDDAISVSDLSQISSISSEDLPNPFTGDPAEARLVYEEWTRHDQTDEEAEQRGGYGKLSFGEFCLKMRPEDEVAEALGVKTKGDEGRKRWESSADLGRLAFVGTWLEMASF
ncbi:hypothetical protein LTR84_004391 [Exophiala bonariae]|uniref:Uncharacterized protein n=1 Tax=Exophiala bonariae TaxID=1690606 RepID=A0AAV9N911_9EURO|nr:hypothetical protein LTR84_004391 [Exophiala bonariae]